MSRFIDYAISHARLTIVTLMFLLLAGFVAYLTIPKEAEPDVRIPIVYVQLTQRGVGVAQRHQAGARMEGCSRSAGARLRELTMVNMPALRSRRS